METDRAQHKKIAKRQKKKRNEEMKYGKKR
jgi:hypothetical protein